MAGHDSCRLSERCERGRSCRWRAGCNGYLITVTWLARLFMLEIRGEGLAGLCDSQKSDTAHRLGDVAMFLRSGKICSGGRILLLGKKLIKNPIFGGMCGQKEKIWGWPFWQREDSAYESSSKWLYIATAFMQLATDVSWCTEWNSVLTW